MVTADGDKKGERIEFVKGGYKGQMGWLNWNKGSTDKQHYVIVKASDKRVEIETRVNKTSVTAEKTPDTYVEDMLDQHPDINEMMEKLVMGTTKCRITAGQSGEAICRLMLDKLQNAEIAQGALGNNATSRDVDWVEEEQQEEQQQQQQPENID